MPSGKTMRPFSIRRRVRIATASAESQSWPGGGAGQRREHRRVHGSVFPFEIEDVGNKKTLLEQILAAAQIVDPWSGLLKPRVGAVEMDPVASHGHAWDRVGVRLLRVTVKDELVQALGVHPVALRLQARTGAPAIWSTPDFR